MESSDENNHDFFEVLSGRKKGNATAEALRKALLDEANAIKQLESNPPEKLSESELARLEAVKRELIKKGVFNSNAENKHKFISYISTLQQYLANHFWQILTVVSLPVILLVSFLIYKLNDDTSLRDIEHIVKIESDKFDAFAKRNINKASMGAIYIDGSHPEAQIDELKKNLKEAGADVFEKRINENEWSLMVSVPVNKNVDAIKNLLNQAGLKVNSEPPYNVVIKKISEN